MRDLSCDGAATGQNAGGKAVVGGHLSAAADRIGGFGQRGQEHLMGGHAEGQHRGQAAVVRNHDVRFAIQGERAADTRSFVALTRDVKCLAALAVEDPLALVDGAREQHHLEHLVQARLAQSQRLVLGLLGSRRRDAIARRRWRLRHEGLPSRWHRCHPGPHRNIAGLSGKPLTRRRDTKAESATQKRHGWAAHSPA